MPGTTHLKPHEVQRVRILYYDGMQSPATIRQLTSYSKSQVKRGINAVEGPRNRRGPPPLLTAKEEAELVAFVTASEANRRMTYLQLPMTLSIVNLANTPSEVPFAASATQTRGI
ncbi:hypothetical protein F5Y19DRAFT_424094 [Xylariaceae sp. FL1651]|nr:hypothetical protein F5Y19DRAFT_424094 [Xylariaceae sp. FL1651]